MSCPVLQLISFQMLYIVFFTHIHFEDNISPLLLNTSFFILGLWQRSVLPRPQEDLGTSEVGSVLNVDLAGSGLDLGPGDEAQPSELYVRAACIDLWDHLETAKKEGNMASFITGCPGIGKSVEVYAYAMWLATQQRDREESEHDGASVGDDRNRVLYIHSHGNAFSIVLTSGTSPASASYGRIKQFTFEPQVLWEYVNFSIKQQQIDVIVLDGKLSWLIERVFLKLGRHSKIRFITCTSFQAFSPNTEQIVRAPRFSQFLMDSWTMEELQSAMDAKVLTLSDPNMTVDEMFYYSGGSVRMFQLSVEEVTTNLNLKIRAVPDMSKLVGQVAVGDSSQSAVNSLMAMYNGVSRVVSKYVVRDLISTQSIEVINSLRGAADENDSWQGWVTELEVLLLVKERKEMLFRRPKPRDAELGNIELERWPRPQKRVGLAMPVFTDPSEIEKIEKFGDNWFVPRRWNQECFDAIYRKSEHEIAAIQVTNAEKHSCKLKYLIPIAQAMNVHVIDLVYVCRRDNFDTFRVPTPQVKPTSNSSNAAVEHQQYQDLMEAFKAIRNAKISPELPVASLPEHDLGIRKVCYEEADSYMPLAAEG